MGEQLSRIVVLCGVCGALLVLGSPVSTASQEPLRPPYAPRGAEPSPADRPFSEVADAHGMPRLDSVVLPEGTREIRLTDSYGMVAGRGIPMLRVVETPEGVEGELIIFWAQSANRPSPASARCVPLRDAVSTCAMVSELEIDWRAVAAELDRLGAWTIEARCHSRLDLRSITDAGDLLIQRLDGERFETYRCNAPRARMDNEDGIRALALWNYVLSWNQP